MKLFYRTLGKGNPLLILHGLFGNSDNWLPSAKHLAGDYRVYLLDMRNHGKSPHDQVFNLVSMVEDIYEFITDLGIRKVSLIGHSMGGLVAMNFAFEYSHRVQRMAIIDIAPRAYPVMHDDILTHLQNIDLRMIKTRHDADLQLADHIPSRRVRQFLLKNLYRQDDSRFAWRLNLPVIAQQLSEIRKGILNPHRISVPVLFIRGGLSDYVREEDRSRISDLFSDYKIETIDRASHWVHSDAPEQLNASLRHFFSPLTRV